MQASTLRMVPTATSTPRTTTTTGTTTLTDSAHDRQFRRSYRAWVTRVLERGSGRNDACLLACAWRAEQRSTPGELDDIDAIAQALVASRERLDEGLAQGRSFARAAATWVDTTTADEHRMLSVTTGALAARAELPLKPVLVASAQAFVSNLVWIGARLVPVGQSEALGVISALLPRVQDVAHSACDMQIDSLGSATPLADIASMRHQHLRSRVCLS